MWHPNVGHFVQIIIDVRPTAEKSRRLWFHRVMERVKIARVYDFFSCSEIYRIQSCRNLCVTERKCAMSTRFPHDCVFLFCTVRSYKLQFCDSAARTMRILYYLFVNYDSMSLFSLLFSLCRPFFSFLSNQQLKLSRSYHI